jgi:hypothetical protein
MRMLEQAHMPPSQKPHAEDKNGGRTDGRASGMPEKSGRFWERTDLGPRTRCQFRQSATNFVILTMAS